MFGQSRPDPTITRFDLVAVGSNSGRSSFVRLKAFDGDPDPFQRGDANDDDAVDIADVITILNYLFAGQGQPACEDAADIDDSGEIVISDAIRLLLHLFSGRTPPEAPSPEPGIDPTPDGLQCLSAAE